MSVWGKLVNRYEGKENDQHKLLALDGGGIRGIMTLEVLARIEEVLALKTDEPDKFRLCHFFDYIGGTSTGAIIAAGLAQGMSTSELLEFYEATGPAMFDKQSIFKKWKALYKAEPLRAELEATFGKNTTLRPEPLDATHQDDRTRQDEKPKYLQTLFLAVMRNRTTDSPWPISSNPLAKYNDTLRPDCNLNIPLWQIVRASTAAPVFFPPEVIQWDPDDEKKAFVFVDGGVTPYNNPAFLLYRMATQKEYKLKWVTGEDKLLVVSVGTGAAPTEKTNVDDPDQGLVENVKGIPNALMYGAVNDQDTNCRLIGRCVHGAPLDREISDMIPRDGDGKMIPLSENLGRQFLYARYNADLSREGLDKLGLNDIQPENVQKLDSVDYIGDLRRVGKAVSKKVSAGHFSPFIV
jgi:predicted acylesterase/phospholipase RssA